MARVPEGRQRNAANAMNNSLFSSQQTMQDYEQSQLFSKSQQSRFANNSNIGLKPSQQ